MLQREANIQLLQEIPVILLHKVEQGAITIISTVKYIRFEFYANDITTTHDQIFDIIDSFMTIMNHGIM